MKFNISNISLPILMKDRQFHSSEYLLIYFLAGLTLIFIVWSYNTELGETYTVKGEILPSEGVVTVQSRMGGVVKSIYIDEGERVEKDQKLLQFDDFEINHKLQKLDTELRIEIERFKYINEIYQTRKKLMTSGLNPKLEFLKLKADRKSLQGKIRQLRNSINEAQDILTLNTVTAPIAGLVHKIKFSQVGAVIPKGQVILEVVPLNKKYIAEVKIPPNKIGHIKVGQKVLVKIDSFDYNQFGGIEGKLLYVSPSTAIDEQENLYFKGKVGLQQTFIPYRSRRLEVMPGMSVVGDINLGTKSVFEYLLKPIFKSAGSALHEK